VCGSFNDLEETLAFAEGRIAPKTVGVDALTQVELSRTVTPAQTIKPRDGLSEREEMQRRMADFKATQHRFEIEREDYFKKTMANLRANSV
jgi:hypothetical protein